MDISLSISILLASITIFLLKRFFFNSTPRSSASNLPPLPEVPGIPILGNLLQLTEKKPHKTFAKWAEKYGPIYSIRTGATTLVVLNNNHVAKEAMITRFSSISTRKVSAALRILTSDKTMVAMSDYNEFHKLVKRSILTHILGPTAQKRNRRLRDTLIDNMSKHLHDFSKNNPLEAVNFRHYFESELFGLALKQSLGKDVESVYVERYGTTFSRDELFQIFVIEPMMGVIEVDWRDFFPYLKWVPNKAFQERLQDMRDRREAALETLIQEAKKRIESGEKTDSYLELLLSLEKPLTDNQILMLCWEVIIETSDTMMVTTEWAMYELAKNPKKQGKLYEELRIVCGSDKVTEEKLSQLPYLCAVFHETVRKYSPAPVIPLRYVHEDTEIGGYHVPAGSEIAINIYGCNMDKNMWESPEDWNPERFLEKNNNITDLHLTMAFGSGKRVCAGALEAFHISCVSIARSVQEFKWRLADGEEDKIDTLGLTTHKLHPMKAVIEPRV